MALQVVNRFQSESLFDVAIRLYGNLNVGVREILKRNSQMIGDPQSGGWVSMGITDFTPAMPTGWDITGGGAWSHYNEFGTSGVRTMAYGVTDLLFSNTAFAFEQGKDYKMIVQYEITQHPCDANVAIRISGASPTPYQPITSFPPSPPLGVGTLNAQFTATSNWVKVYFEELGLWSQGSYLIKSIEFQEIATVIVLPTSVTYDDNVEDERRQIIQVPIQGDELLEVNRFANESLFDLAVRLYGDLTLGIASILKYHPSFGSAQITQIYFRDTTQGYTGDWNEIGTGTIWLWYYNFGIKPQSITFPIKKLLNGGSPTVYKKNVKYTVVMGYRVDDASSDYQLRAGLTPNDGSYETWLLTIGQLPSAPLFQGTYSLSMEFTSPEDSYLIFEVTSWTSGNVYIQNITSYEHTTVAEDVIRYNPKLSRVKSVIQVPITEPENAPVLFASESLYDASIRLYGSVEDGLPELLKFYTL